MKEEFSKKSARLIFVIILILSAFVIASNVAIICLNGITVRMIRNFISIAISLATVFYLFFAYKKPHGNELRYTMMIFACFVAICAPFENGDEDNYVRVASKICSVLSGVFAGYMAGRLHKIKKNRILIISAFVLLLAKVFLYFGTSSGSYLYKNAVENGLAEAFRILGQAKKGSDTPLSLHIIRQCMPLIQWTALSLAYYVRYKQHKEAGLLDTE